MAKKKTKKVEKETRRLIESISDLIKEKNGKIKFKTSKKKTIREVKKNCPHWRLVKGEERPAVIIRNDGYCVCRICGKMFPINPLDPEGYVLKSEEFLALVNQALFYSVKMGGNANDTKIFLKLKDLIPRFGKIAKNEMKRLTKVMENEKRKGMEIESQFSNYDVFTYRD